jgi:C4-dicarboxylate transporter DctQ subunit
MCFRFLQVTSGFLRTGELPRHDQGKVEGIEDAEPPAPGEEDRIYRMEDGLHPRDTPHSGDTPKNEQP